MNTWTRLVGALSCAGIVSLGTAQGAQAEGKPLRLGIRAGLQLRWVSSDPAVTGMDLTGGPNAGALVNYGLSDKLGLQAGTYFIQKGFKSSKTTQSQTTNEDVKLNYLEIQALANWSPEGTFPRRFYLLAGPSLGFRTSASQKTEVVASGGTTTTELDVSSFYKSTDVSLLGGVGYGFGKTGAFSLEARFLLGLTNISALDTTNVKNRGVSILLGYNFAL